MPLPIAIVLGLSVTGLAVVRELAANGIPVVGISQGLECGRFSRRLLVPNLRWEAGNDLVFVSELIRLADNSGESPVLIPTSDHGLAFVSEHAEELEACLRFQGSYSSGVAGKLLDKTRFVELCQQHGMEGPASWLGKLSEMSRLEDELRFPCILKPSRNHLARPFLGGRKVLLARSREQFARLVKSIPDELTSWLVQEIIPGPDSNIRIVGVYMDSLGEPQQVFTGVKVRQYPPGFGSASLAVSSPQPDLAECTTRFLQALGFQGIAAVEFKIDARDQRPRIIEINPRPALWHGLAVNAGKPLVLAAYHDLCGHEPSPNQPQRDGVVWRYPLKDAYSALFYLLRGRNFVLGVPDVKAWLSRPGSSFISAVYERGDPWPSVVEPLLYVGKAVSRLKAMVRRCYASVGTKLP